MSFVSVEWYNYYVFMQDDLLIRRVITLSHDNVNYLVETMSAITVVTDWATSSSGLISLHGKCTLSRVCTIAGLRFILSTNSVYFPDTATESRSGTVLRLCSVNEPTDRRFIETRPMTVWILLEKDQTNYKRLSSIV